MRQSFSMKVKRIFFISQEAFCNEKIHAWAKKYYLRNIVVFTKSFNYKNKEIIVKICDI